MFVQACGRGRAERAQAAAGRRGHTHTRTEDTHTHTQRHTSCPTCCRYSIRAGPPPSRISTLTCSIPILNSRTTQSTNESCNSSNDVRRYITLLLLYVYSVTTISLTGMCEMCAIFIRDVKIDAICCVVVSIINAVRIFLVMLFFFRLIGF